VLAVVVGPCTVVLTARGVGSMEQEEIGRCMGERMSLEGYENTVDEEPLLLVGGFEYAKAHRLGETVEGAEEESGSAETVEPTLLSRPGHTASVFDWWLQSQLGI
jgi:hypothetical protein